MPSMQTGLLRFLTPEARDQFAVPSDAAAEYIKQICGELVQLAEEGNLGFLAYLLDVAREEALLHCDSSNGRGTVELHGELPPS